MLNYDPAANKARIDSQNAAAKSKLYGEYARIRQGTNNQAQVQSFQPQKHAGSMPPRMP